MLFLPSHSSLCAFFVNQNIARDKIMREKLEALIKQLLFSAFFIKTSSVKQKENIQSVISKKLCWKQNKFLFISIVMNIKLRNCMNFFSGQDDFLNFLTFFLV